MGREASAINHGVGRVWAEPRPGEERKVIFRPANLVAPLRVPAAAAEEVGGVSHSLFFECSDTTHLQPPGMVRDEPRLKVQTVSCRKSQPAGFIFHHGGAALT